MPSCSSFLSWFIFVLDINLPLQLCETYSPGDRAEWRGKILIIESADDPMINEKERRRLKAMYPEADVYTFEGTGHLIPLLKLDEMLDVIRGFLEKTKYCLQLEVSVLPLTRIHTKRGEKKETTMKSKSHIFMLIAILFLIASLTSGAFAQSSASRKAAASDWPQWRGPQRNGVSNESGLLKEWPKEGGKTAMAVEGHRRGLLDARRCRGTDLLVEQSRAGE